MVMSITIYKCQECGARHDSYDDAVRCENLPMYEGDPEYNEGDDIEFENEDNMMGVRWSYSYRSGKVLYRVKMLNHLNTAHQWYYMVDGNYCEYGVSMVTDSDGFRKMMCMYDSKFEKGTTERGREMDIQWRKI